MQDLIEQTLAIVLKPQNQPAPKRRLAYDYTHQAWIENGRYLNCGHPAGMACGCYGRAHEGQLAAPGAEIH